MTEFKKLKPPFSNYEVSENFVVIRNKKKSIISSDKGLFNLINDSGDPVTINKKDLKEKLIIDSIQSVEEVNIKNQQPKSILKKSHERKRENKIRNNSRIKKGEIIEITSELKEIIEYKGSKASKMGRVYDITKSIKKTSIILKTNYSYVYNYLIWNPEQKLKK